MTAPPPRPASPPPPPPRKPTDIPLSSDLVVSSRLSFVTRRVPDRKAAPYWEPVRTGSGGYADVFRMRECVNHDSSQFAGTPLSRSLVAKVFRDVARNDLEAVYARELQTLLGLGYHERIVNLRSAFDNVAPTFICGHIDCGKVFHVDHCPQCQQVLRNGDEAGDILLVCSNGHRYKNGDAEQFRGLTATRPCRHTDDCTPINFLFRPYILLEELNYDLRVLNGLLAGRTAGHGEPVGLPFESKPNTDERQRETLLFRLDTLIGVAEGIAFLHAKGCLHADIAPDNVMVRLALDLEARGTVLGAADTKLIDFGLAKRLEENRTISALVGRMTFFAPEQQIVDFTGPKVSIRFRNGVAQENEICQLVTINGDDLSFERRDSVSDTDGGQYVIVDSSELPGEAFPFGSQGADQKPERERALYARVLKPPNSGRDVLQTDLSYSHALDVPTDIFSLGCLIAWSTTGGQEDLVLLLRDQANVATRRKEVLGAGFCAQFLRDDYKKVSNAIDLPRTTEDEEIREHILDVVCRCLVRSEGAYCRRRTSGFTNPAAAIAADLKKIRNVLFLMVHTQTELARYLNNRSAAENARIQHLTEELDALAVERSALRRKGSLWQTASIVIGLAALGLTAFLQFPGNARSDTPPSPERTATTPPAPPVAAAATTAATIPQSPAPVGLPPAPQPTPKVEPVEPTPQSPVEPTPPADDPSKKAEPAKKSTTKKGGSRPSTMQSIAKTDGGGAARLHCKPAHTSLAPKGTIKVEYQFDPNGEKSVKDVILKGISKDFSLSNDACVRSLKNVDFSGAVDHQISVIVDYAIPPLLAKEGA